MKRILLSFLALACLCSVHGQDKEALSATIRALDLAHAQAIFRGDAASLDTLMEDEVTVNHPTNRIVREKAELMQMIRKGVIRYSTFERFPDEILLYPGMAVVMGHEFVTPARGAPKAGRKLQRRYTNIWLLRNGHWRLAIRHANNVCTD